MEMVFVKGADGVERKLALLYETATAVFVCRPERYADMKAGRAEMPCVGFPLEDVRPAEKGQQAKRSI